MRNNSICQGIWRLIHKERTATDITDEISAFQVDKEERKEEPFYLGNMIFSKNINTQNILIDTSCFHYKELLDIVDNSSKTTVLLATINEMDDVKRNLRKKGSYLEPSEKFFLYQLGNYAKRFLKEEKYRLVPFVGENQYVDKNIIEYILSQPVNERQTIVTGDVILANRAKCHGIEYILYFYEKTEAKQKREEEEVSLITDSVKKERMNENSSADENTFNEQKEIIETPEILENEKNMQEEKIVPEVYTQKGEFGVSIEVNKSKQVVVRNFNPYADVFYVDDNQCEMILSKSRTLEKIDYIAIVAEVKKYHDVKIQKVVIDENGVVKRKDYVCECINEIYKLEDIFDEKILETAKNRILLL